MPSPDANAQALIDLAVAFLTGATTRNRISADSWNSLMTFAGQFAQMNQDPRHGRPGDTPRDQPLALIQRMMEHFNDGDLFTSSFEQGQAANIWVKDKTTDTGWIYNTAIGQPGDGKAGDPPAGTLNPPPPPKDRGARQTRLNKQATFESLLTSLGIAQDDNLTSLVQKAAKEGWNAARFQNALYDTTEFHDEFPGIFNGDGTLKMSPAQYLRSVTQFQSYAAQYGVNLNDKKTAFLFHNDVSPAEFAQRAQADTTLRTNKQYFDAFNEQRKQMGLAPLDRGQLFKFVMGEGNQDWYDMWNKSTTRYAGEEAGIAFGKVAKAYTHLGQGIVNEIAGKGLSLTDQTAAFQKLANDLTTTLPISRIQKMGVSKKDLVELEFGGPHQAAIAKRVQQALANEKSFDTGQTTAATPQGLRGTAPRGYSGGDTEGA